MKPDPEEQGAGKKKKKKKKKGYRIQGKRETGEKDWQWRPFKDKKYQMQIGTSFDRHVRETRKSTHRVRGTGILLDELA